MSLNKSVLKSVLMPREHGSWAFVLEPVLLGTIISGSWQGLWVVGGALFGFLSYRPLKLGIRDVLARKSYPRTKVGLSIGILFLAVAAWCMWSGAPEHPDYYLQAVFAFAMLGIVFAVADARLSTGALDRELLGALLTVPLAPAAYEAGNPVGGQGYVFALWLVLLCVSKSVPTVLYVRARLRPSEERGSMPHWAFAAGMLGYLATGFTGLSFGYVFIFAAVYVALLGRLMWGLSKWALTLKPKHVGIQEFAYSILFLSLAALLLS